MTSIAWFRDLRRDDTSVAGGKGANLGELAAAGFLVPPGFVVTAGAYLRAMDAGGVRARLHEEAMGVDVDDPVALDAASERLRALVVGAGMPEALRAEILAAYHELGRDSVVAVRSSATSEDTAATSFAG
ncbi:MAG: PEP/pyruvate-binding domain-containing protein, partial [Acidimicrobiia bacterium]